jgi:thymidylate synthase (FAD)
MGSDESIENAARISYSSNKTRKVTDTKNLLRYLMRHKHTSPFEQAIVQFEIKFPIFLARQFFRHRTLSGNEISGRYSILPEEFYLPEMENIQKQSTDNKQGREDSGLDVQSQLIVQSIVSKNSEDAFEAYHELDKMGIARELSRITLPLNTYTVVVFQMNLHNFFHFTKLRTHPHAQLEMQAYANAMYEMVRKIFPISAEAFETYELFSVNFSQSEFLILLNILFNLKLDHNKIDWNQIEKMVDISKREITEFKEKLFIPYEMLLENMDEEREENN